MGFIERVQQAVLLFRDRVKTGPVLVVGNLDTDGITSTSILIKALSREGLTCSVQIVKQLHDELLQEIKESPYATVIFTDLGSGTLVGIETFLEGKSVFIFDHHYPEKNEIADWIVQVNPHLDGIDGTTDISAAGVCYFFARELNNENKDVAHLALIGAVGDVQEKMGFSGFNQDILRDALGQGTLEMQEGLRIFGIYTKPLHRVLEYSTNPYIPGVSSDREGAVRFLEDHQIVPQGKGREVKLSDLDTIAVERLQSLLQQRVKGDCIGPVYLLTGESDNNPLREIKEFSTLLNACGRTGKATLGVGVCLGDVASRKKALEIFDDYRREIQQALEWFYKHRGGKQVIEHKGFTLIHAESDVRDGIIGTLTSLVSKSKVYPDKTIIVGMAYTVGGEIKLSFRISGFEKTDVDVRKIVNELIVEIGGNGGGHRLAAGATIPQEQEDALMITLVRLLEQAVIVENVVV
jgi:single-stranded-DNA-specific exonuclease